MPSAEEIKTQLEELGFNVNDLPKTEIKALPNILRDDERIKSIASGLYSNHNGVLVATNIRVFFFYKGRFFGEQVEDFSYNKISSIEYETGMIGGSITILASGNAAKIDVVPNVYCRPFVNTVREIISNLSQPPKVEISKDLLSKLERLAALKQAGMLTDEEFTAAKAKLLLE